MKQRIILFFSLALIHAREDLLLPLCNFSVLPKDIHKRIAFYLPYSNKVYETDESFLNRIKKSEGIDERHRLSHGQIAKRYKNGNEWVVDGINIFWPTKSKDKNLKIDRILQYYALSITHNYMTTVALDSSILFSPRDQIQLFKLSNQQYSLEWSNNTNPLGGVQGIAISNTGQFAIIKNTRGLKSVNLIDQEKDEQKYDLSLKYNSDNYLCWAIKIVDLLFNNQSSKLGIKTHFLYEALIDETHVDEVKFRRILKEWFVQNYEQKYKSILTDTKYERVIKLLDRPIESHKYFWERFKGIINNSEAYKIIHTDIAHGSNELSPIKIISLQEEEPWSLTKYFRKKGICKDLNMQCGIQE